MKYIIFLLLVLIFFLIYYFNKEILFLKNKILLLNNQISTLKHKLFVHTKKDLFIQYFSPKYDIGILTSNSQIKLSPYESSCSITSISFDTEVILLDMALIDSIYWYYISVPSKNDINSHGWVEEKSFISFFSKENNNIIKK